MLILGCFSAYIYIYIYMYVCMCCYDGIFQKNPIEMFNPILNIFRPPILKKPMLGVPRRSSTRPWRCSARRVPQSRVASARTRRPASGDSRFNTSHHKKFGFRVFGFLGGFGFFGESKAFN